MTHDDHKDLGLRCTEQSSPGEPSEDLGLRGTEQSSPGEPFPPGATLPPDPVIRGATPGAPVVRIAARTTPEDLPPGTMIGEFQVTEKLGAGGMGAVYMGIHPVIGKRVAIKVLLSSSAMDQEVINRFILEARAVNKIGSQYIVDIFSFGLLADGRNYFVMELLEGYSLRELLRSRGRLSIAEARPIITCVARGLVAAHAKEIVHRDIKPENIMVLRDEDQQWRAKLLDFGIAKLQDVSDKPPGFATRTGMAMGTPFYMSPEQCRGIGVDHRTDIYAIGVVVFEVLTGRQPFFAESYIDLVNQHLYSPPPAPSAYLPGIPPALDHFILKSLAKDPAERHQTMDEFLQQFTGVLSTLEQDLGAPAGLQVASAAASLDDSDSMSRSVLPGARVSRRVASRRWLFAGLGVLLITMILVTGWALWGPRGARSNRGVAPKVLPLAQDRGPQPARNDLGSRHEEGDAPRQEPVDETHHRRVLHKKKRHKKKRRSKKRLKQQDKRVKKKPHHESPPDDRDKTLNPF